MTDYHRMSVAQKLALQRAGVREPSISCPGCDARVMPADLLQHAERCQGPRGREPHHLARWLTAREARQLGASRPTLSRLVACGLVRARGGPRAREYLLADVARQLAVRVLAKRFPVAPTPRGGAKVLGRGAPLSGEGLALSLRAPITGSAASRPTGGQA